MGKSLLLAMSLFFGFFVYALAVHIPWGQLIAVSSFVIVASGVVAGCLSLGRTRLVNMFKGQDSEASRTLVTLALAAGDIGFLLSFLVLYNNLNNPHVFGPGLAVAFIALLYSVLVVVLLAFLSRNSLEDKIVGGSKRKLGASAIGALLFAGVLATAFIKGVPLSQLVSLPSAFLIFAVLAAFMVSQGAPAVISAVRGQDPQTARAIIRTLFYAGYAGIALGLMRFFTSIQTPEEVGPAIYSMLMAFLYVMFFAGFLAAANKVSALSREFGTFLLVSVFTSLALFGYVVHVLPVHT